MISISSIREYMFCPHKFYLRHSLGDRDEENVFLSKRMKRLRIDVYDLIQRNIRGLKAEMSLDDIKNNLKRTIKEVLESSLNILKEDYNILQEEIDRIKMDIVNEVCFKIDILSLKSLKAMQSLESDGHKIAEMFFPTSMYNYLMRDLNLEIIGSCDKIEIVDGRYYPINIKVFNPPIAGVWDSDAIELVANAILIEQEFDSEVFVGFIDYSKICERRPVIMDSKLRKGLFKVLHEMKEIIDGDIISETKFDSKKCGSCSYQELCYMNDENQSINAFY
ncbi:MAG: Dna2/Cas4 domain-containing protein [Methanobrevibacter sp.]|jgi:CRISPR-associated exonuclease Cas4|nr:Dna2/Cas4 domain-containing protein [Candidatus Methanovirga procula]